MNEWLKKNYLYCILICFILGIVILLTTWFYLENFRGFLVFLASILIASSGYMTFFAFRSSKAPANFCISGRPTVFSHLFA